MNEAKIIGICNRISITRPAQRGPLLAELVPAIDEGEGYTVNRKLSATNDLRAMLEWPEVKSSPQPTARIARTLRDMRDQ